MRVEKTEMPREKQREEAQLMGFQGDNKNPIVNEWIIRHSRYNLGKTMASLGLCHLLFKNTMD